MVAVEVGREHWMVVVEVRQGTLGVDGPLSKDDETTRRDEEEEERRRRSRRRSRRRRQLTGTSYQWDGSCSKIIPQIGTNSMAISGISSGISSDILSDILSNFLLHILCPISSYMRSGREHLAWILAVEVRQGTLGVDGRG